jgi:flagellar biosynthesis/type III secretory pathway protein FliH
LSTERARFHEEPAKVALADGEGGDVLARLIARRERTAFEVGERAGRAQAMAQAVVRLDEAAARFDASIQASNATLVSDSVELAIAIAAELVRSEVEARRHGIEALVRDTLHASGVGRATCTVHVSPQDAEALSKLAFRAGTRIESDPDVPCASIQVETPQGLLVRDIESSLASVAARLREEART